MNVGVGVFVPIEVEEALGFLQEELQVGKLLLIDMAYVFKKKVMAGTRFCAHFSQEPTMIVRDLENKV